MGKGVVSEKDAEKEWLCLTTIAAAMHDLSPSYIAPIPRLQPYVSRMKRQLVLAKVNPDRFNNIRECYGSDPDHPTTV